MKVAAVQWYKNALAPIKLCADALPARVCTAIVCGVMSVLPAAHAAGPKIVRVALSDTSPPISFASNGKPAGVLADLVEALFQHIPEYRPQLHSLPWIRAQWAVESGSMDVFITFPSANRSLYGNFAESSLYALDYGNIVYDRTGSKAPLIESALSFQDMRDLVFVTQDSVAWEAEHVPDYIARYTVKGPPSLMHMTFRRKVGDFFIMSAEQAAYYAKQLGYEKQLGMKRVAFIPHSLVELHIGIRKSYPDESRLMRAVNGAMKHPEFKAKKAAIIAKYRQGLAAAP